MAGPRRQRSTCIRRPDAARILGAELREQLRVRATAACDGVENGRGVVWLEPRAVAEVQFNELMLWRLRDPVLRAIYVKR